jgi:outer membrane lipoprotein-sorting protein
MGFAVLALLLPTSVAVGQGRANEAEKLFRQVEKRIASAKSLKALSRTVRAEKPGQDVTFEVSLERAGPDKARLKFTRKVGGKDVVLEVTADGKKLRVTGLGPPRDAAIPDKFGELLNKMVSRTGLSEVSVLLFLQPKPGEPEELFKVKDFELGKAGKVNGRDARVIRYRVGSTAVTLWVDGQTLLPLKRLLVYENVGARGTESYREFTLDPKLPPKLFELPR